MNKLFGLFLLAVAFLAPVGAEAANRFWVGGTGTWDGSDTTHWSATDGGAGGASVPGTGDAAVFNANSGGGTVTVASSIGGSNTIQSVTAGAFTGTLDFSANNPSITFSTAAGMSLTGSGARKFLLGTGTFTFTATTGGSYFDLSTTTNLDPTSVLTANFTFSGNMTLTRTFAGGGRAYGTLTVSSNSSRGQFVITGANTFAAMSLAAGTWVTLPAGSTTAVTAAPTWTGTGSLPITLYVSNPASGAATISVASGTVAMDYVYLYLITGTGGATFNATNSFDGGRNTGITITPPSGGGGGGRIIGGFLLKRDLEPVSNDNDPMWLEKAA